MQIDHITVVASSLEEGGDFVFDALGVMPRLGGQHPRMGTHNLLLRLGDTMFLEVIAIDPRAQKPPRPRWFGLDERAPGAPPGLATWVARTADIRAAAAALPVDLGAVETMTRGDLEWLITIPADGRLRLDGAAPSLIEWHTGAHPAASMPHARCALAGFTVTHPDPSSVSALLDAMDLEDDVAVEAGPKAALSAVIETPAGLRTLGCARR